MKIKLISVLLVISVVIFLATCGRKKEVAEQIPVEKPAEKRGTELTVKPRPSTAPITEEKILCSFERGYEGFEIPDWAMEKEDNAGRSLNLSKDFASEGCQSLCLVADYPGNIWSSALIELEQYLDLTPYREVATDVYIPKEAPLGLKAKIVLTVGEDWTWTEMSGSVPLVPGEWVTIRASLEPGTLDWKRTEVDDAFRADVRKIVVRIESNRRPDYKGPIYIDNIRVGR